MRVLVYLSNCDDHAEELLRSVEQSPVLGRVSNLWKGELLKADAVKDSVVMIYCGSAFGNKHSFSTTTKLVQNLAFQRSSIISPRQLASEFLLEF